MGSGRPECPDGPLRLGKPYGLGPQTTKDNASDLVRNIILFVDFLNYYM